MQQQLSAVEIKTRAVDIVEILRMWDIPLTSALAIAHAMAAIIETTPIKAWTNPLEGTGLSVPGNPGYNNANTAKAKH